MSHIALHGGEQDGKLIPSDSLRDKKHPEVYFAVPLRDDEKVRSARGQQKQKLQEKLGTLAYKFDKKVMKDGLGLEYVYVRSPDLDKTTT